MDLIESVASTIALKIKKSNPEITSGIDDIRFGIAYYINYYSVIFITIIIGWMTNEFLNSSLALIALGFLRKYTGGYHFRSITACAIFTIVVLSLIPHVIFNHMLLIPFINIVAFLLVSISDGSRSKKHIALMLIASNFIFNSSVVALVFLVQAVSLWKEVITNMKKLTAFIAKKAAAVQNKTARKEWFGKPKATKK